MVGITKNSPNYVDKNLSLNKQLLLEKVRYYDLSDSVAETMKSVDNMQEDLRMSDKGELYLAKIQLERTVKNLANEVESLSLK